MKVLVDLRRVILALHPACDPGCVLDNDRVWALCGSQRLIDSGLFSEEEIRQAILALPKRRVRRRSSHARPHA